MSNPSRPPAAAPNQPPALSVFNVLFICTGNSARSIMAEAILNHLGHGRFQAFSAGSHPTGQVNPHAIKLLQRSHIKTESLRSKNWDEFTEPNAPHMDCVITVCDKAAGEACPWWPSQPISAHWGLPDPAATRADDDASESAFAESFRILSHRIALMVSLPAGPLNRLALQQALVDIGRQKAWTDRLPNTAWSPLRSGIFFFEVSDGCF